MNQITKKQHYVPQFLLKYFGYGAKNKEKINIFYIHQLYTRYNQPVKGNFSQNYFYDRDNLVEDFLGKQIETPASKVIGKIVDDKLNLTKEESLTLNRFILSLHSRTPEASERVSKFVNSSIESIVREGCELNGLDPEIAKEGHFEFNSDVLASSITVDAVVNATLLEDLDYHLIKNETQLEFYISDHPVFIYNWLYRDLDHPAVTSLTARGLQIFIPLSPKRLLCLYDSKVYKYGSKSSVTCLFDDKDIEILNSFQVINSSSVIGFHSRESETKVKKLYKKYKHIHMYNYESMILSTDFQENGKIRSTHLSFKHQFKLANMPKFIKLKKKAKDYHSFYQERDPERSAKHRDFIEFFDERTQRRAIELT